MSTEERISPQTKINYTLWILLNRATVVDTWSADQIAEVRTKL